MSISFYSFPKILSLLCAVVSVSFLSCTGNKDCEVPDTSDFETTAWSSPVVSQKAYERGYAAGKAIMLKEAGTKEREQAVIEIHAMVSALERNGYRQSAIDFSKGVQAALNGR